MDDRHLKDILNAQDDIPPAREDAKRRAMNLAMAAFDEAQKENLESSQGIGTWGRLISQLNLFKGRRLMNTFTTKQLMFGGTATAMALVLSVVTYTTMQQARLDGWMYEIPQNELPSVEEQQKIKELRDHYFGGKPKTETDGAQGGGQVANQSANEPMAEIAEKKTEMPAKPGPSSVSPAREAEASSQMAQSKPDADATGALRRQMAPPQAAQQPAASPLAGLALKDQTFAKSKEAFPRDRRALAAPQLLGSNQGVAQPADIVAQQYKDVGRDTFETVEENAIKRVADTPVSTFSVDVDTASYAFVRRELNRSVLPQKDAVRVEELINYFHYDYPLAETKEQPFQPTVTVTDSPWKPGNKLVHIGIKGYDIDAAEKPRSNLVFLLDVSGSMGAVDKLPLLVNSMKLLLDTLNPYDTVAIVVYAGAAGTVLEPTKAADKHKIIAALDRLRSGGSTAGAEGIRQAYALAQSQFDEKAVNRVILATDGDFNVGITNREELKGFVERKRKTGIFLSVLGFGQGNLNDHMMQTLAQNGNGVAAHIDTLSEARKVLVDEASSMLFPIAKDVKIQVEFNPKTVAEYRLIGYETRALKREDFKNDKVDAGDIGAGHTVTAIYEITPAGSENQMLGVSRYEPTAKPGGHHDSEYGFLKMRYKLPKESTSKLITTPIAVTPETDTARLQDTNWATAVAAFGQILKGGKYTGSYSYDDVIALAQSAKGADPYGYRAEFINMVRLAKSASALPRN